MSFYPSEWFANTQEALIAAANAQEVNRLRAELTALREERDRLWGALSQLCDKLDAVTEGTAGLWPYLAAHGMEYDGPDYGKELAAARKIL